MTDDDDIEFNVNGEFREFKYGPASDPFRDLNIPSSRDEIPLDEWVPDRAIDAINMERNMHPNLSEIELANKILKENLPLIAAGITHTAKYARDARLRFQAQTYVMDRVLGKVGVNNLSDADPMDELFNALIKSVNEVTK